LLNVLITSQLEATTEAVGELGQIAKLLLRALQYQMLS